MRKEERKIYVLSDGSGYYTEGEEKLRDNYCEKNNCTYTVKKITIEK